MTRFVSLNSAANYFEVSKKSLQNLSYIDKSHNRNDRFMVDKNGVLKIHPNYKCPHYDLITELYFKALECAKNEKEIARFIAKRTGKNEHCVYIYFRNFKFKNADFARIVIKLLKIFIKNNSLFADELLKDLNTSETI